jgi:hypothetical protein
MWATRGVLLVVAAIAMVVLAGAGGDAVDRPSHGHRAGFPAVGERVFGELGAPGNLDRRWGSVDCAQASRVRLHRVGGDSSRRPDGKPQRAPGYLRLRVQDGDNVSGERCELGRNDHRFGPTALYEEGERLVTFLSLRLRDRFPLREREFQVLMQMKQAQPSDGGGGTPVLELDAFDRRWRLGHTGEAISAPDNSQVWSAPARKRTWVRFAFDVVYSADPRVGSVRVYADLNGDGDAKDRRERSRLIRLATLKREEAGDPSDGFDEGDPLTSHLRVGIYHDSSYVCERNECAIDVDNIGVYRR